jgi:hypothetical protein
MKNHSSFGIALLALASVIFSGCDKVDDLTDFQFHSSFEESIPVVDASISDTPKDYSHVLTFDATSDSEIQKYKTKIKSFSIDKITYIVDDSENVTKGVKFNGTLGFSASDGGAATVLTTVTNLDLDDHTTIHEITLAQADLDKIAGYLTANKAFKIYLAGKVSKTPINVVVNVKVAVTVVSNAL